MAKSKIYLEVSSSKSEREITRVSIGLGKGHKSPLRGHGSSDKSSLLTYDCISSSFVSERSYSSEYLRPDEIGQIFLKLRPTPLNPDGSRVEQLGRYLRSRGKSFSPNIFVPSHTFNPRFLQGHSKLGSPDLAINLRYQSAGGTQKRKSISALPFFFASPISSLCKSRYSL